MRRRWVLVMLLTASALALSGCEEGEIPDIIDPGTGTQNLTLDQITVNPAKGEAVTFQATVTRDGTAQNNVVVTFTSENPPLVSNEQFSPSSPQTNVAGIATATLSTVIGTPTTFDVRATAAGGGTSVLTVSLQPAP